MVGLGLILIMAGVIFLIIGAAQAAQNRNFKNAQMVTGTVIHKHSKQEKNGRAHLLKLAYSVDGNDYEREVGVLLTEYDAIEVGDQYTVQYRPDKPQRILRPQDTNPKVVKVFLLIGAGMLVAGVALLAVIRLSNI